MEFAVYLIHALADDWDRPYRDVYQVLNETGILDDYILPFYDVLHTQGKQYLVEDITGFVRDKGVQVWLRLVVDCRNGKNVFRNYDVVIGNVANDDVFKCASMFMDGIWDEERTLDELRYFRKNDQIAFLTQDVIDAVVKFKESYEVSR